MSAALLARRAPRPLLARRGGMSFRSRRAVGSVWFALITIPFIFFGGGMAVDFTRIIAATHELDTAAEAAALGGAFQFAPGQQVLDQGTAAAVARDTFSTAVDAGVTRMVDSTSAQVSTSATSVTVRAPYQLAGLPFIQFFLADGTYHGTVERTATVCVPGQAGATDGYCTRPR